MDITKTLSKISEHRTTAIMNGDTSIIDQLEKLMAIAVAISKLDEGENSIDYEERQELIKQFRLEMKQVPEKYQPYNTTKK